MAIVNWDALAAVGEIVGAAAVVATLLYLGTQVRQSNRISQAEAVRSVNDAFTSLAMEIAKSSELRRVWGKLPDLQSVEDLDADERVILEMILRSAFNTVSHGFESHALGLSITGAAEMRWLRNNLLVLPVVQQWWEASPMQDSSYGERFVHAVNRMIRETQSA